MIRVAPSRHRLISLAVGPRDRRDLFRADTARRRFGTTSGISPSGCVAALSGASVDTQTASDVGARLVAGGFTGAQSLSRTFEVLREALPAAARGAGTQPSCDQIIQLLGALAAGYTWALRNLVCDQQEEVKRALSLAWQDLEGDLRVSEARFREVFDFSPVGIAITEDDGRIIQANRSLEKILGYSRGELLGRQLSDLPVAGYQPIVEEHYRDLAGGSGFAVPGPPPAAPGGWRHRMGLPRRLGAAQNQAGPPARRHNGRGHHRPAPSRAAVAPPDAA